MVGDGGNAAPGAAESPVLAGVYVHPSHGTAPPVLRGFVAHAEQNQRATMEDRCGVWETLPGACWRPGGLALCFVPRVALT